MFFFTHFLVTYMSTLVIVASLNKLTVCLLEWCKITDIAVIKYHLSNSKSCNNHQSSAVSVLPSLNLICAIDNHLVTQQWRHCNPVLQSLSVCIHRFRRTIATKAIEYQLVI